MQTESVDPLPGESQPSGKIRKGFKLFGKRKPGNIFTIRSKEDANTKSPANKSKSLDGLSETGEADLVQKPDGDGGQEVSQGERERREEEAALGEAGMHQALAHSRNSVSSTSSARSLKFLSLLRGGRQGTGGRRVHTVSQPVGRQRRGLKGLFGTVRLKSKDKEEAPPSPLLKSSRANSVEIIKEDLTLTPRVQPRSLDSPETENAEPVQSCSSQDGTPPSPPEPAASRAAAGDVSTASKRVPPLPSWQPPLEPGDHRLSNLLADISSLLTFESISDGGDVMADVEAEWGNANATSKPTSPVYKPSKPSPLTSTAARNASVSKGSSADLSVTLPAQTSAPAAQSSSPTAARAAPSSVITSAKASSLAASSDSLSSGSAHNLSAATSTYKARLSSTSSSPLQTKSAVSSASMTPATVAPKTSPAPGKAATFTVSTLPTETVASPQLVPSAVKPRQVTSPPVSRGSTSPAAFHQAPTDTLDSVTTPELQSPTAPRPSPAGGTSTEAAAATAGRSVGSSRLEPLVSRTPPFSSSASVSEAAFGVAETDSSPTPTSLATLPQACPSPSPSSTSKTQPGPSSAPPAAPGLPAQTVDIPPLTSDEVAASAPATETPTATTPTHSQTSQSKSTSGQGQTAGFVAKDPPAQTPTSDAKKRPAQIGSVGSKLSFDADQITWEDPPARDTTEDTFKDAELAATPAPLSASAPSPASSRSSPSWPSEAPLGLVGNGGLSSDGQGGSPTSKEPPRAQADEQRKEPHTSLQVTPKEGKTQHPKASGLSKIPVVGGGRVGKLPVRESQQAGPDAVGELPSPEAGKDGAHPNARDAGGKEQSSDGSPAGLRSTRAQEKSPQLAQPKVLSGPPRDSKIPLKHSPHTGSQTPAARDGPRTKIPVSRVPVRRLGNKPAVAYGSSHMRK